jgi:PAS domain S-box-containing protein
VSPRASGERFRAVIESYSQVVSLLDRDGRVIYINGAIEGCLGRTAESCQDRGFAECLGADGESFARLLAASLAGDASTAPLEGRDQAGQARSLEVRLLDRLADPVIAAVVAFVEDVSDRRRRPAPGAERGARGLLPPAVIHELTNPLAAIVTSLELAATRLQGTGRVAVPGPVHAAELAEDLRSARQATERVRQIVRDLSVFSAPEPVRSAAAEAPGSQRRGRVLVVDDEPTINSAIARTLTPEHDVATVTRASDALARLRSGERYDVIFCDLMMPHMTGMELHSELVAELPEQAARMIFLTGGAFTVAARRFLDQVPNLRIEKPFDTRMLRKLVNERVA